MATDYFTKIEVVAFWLILNVASIAILLLSGRSKKEKARNKKALIFLVAAQVVIAAILLFKRFSETGK